MTELAIASDNPAADWGVVVPISHSAVLVVVDCPWPWYMLQALEEEARR
jgi:hypothetical protein